MKNRKYTKPTISIVEISNTETLLTASCDNCTCGCNHKPGIGGCANCDKCNNNYDGWQETQTIEDYDDEMNIY